ncbi:MAG: RNA-binding transcriptional accessory protein [Candidatus Kapabacteria bacterium]|nr:RNA-binding transcriptional accessory protein [Ignavibacteriota bacterium]MCW5883835.1 RNA-binding transcriptional accessory protein [Candidatus Kapabacteria bacterium]
MLNLILYISKDLNIEISRVENALKLRSEGGTVPFIARYRKEITGNLDEIELRNIFDKFDYLTELEDRKKTILASIEEQGKLSDELREKIVACLQKNELEDLYLPYKPKRRTRATIAKEKGLEPLAAFIKNANLNKIQNPNLELEASKYISEELGVTDIKSALAGASDIIAEEVAENADFRNWVRDFFIKNGKFKSSIKDEFPEGSTKYENYRNFEKPVSEIAPHAMLALRRGETEGILNLDITFDESEILNFMNSKNIHNSNIEISNFLVSVNKDAFSRLMKHSLIGEVRMLKKEFSDEESIKVFESNLRQMLLAAPAGMKPTIGIDPGFRTGCKVVVLDGTGRFLEYSAIFPHSSKFQKDEATKYLKNAIEKYGIELIAIGNGTAGRETDEFVTETIKDVPKKPIKVMVNESGASIYSASETAGKEFPELDLTVRGAISIGRRLQDPLAELVKIDPKSIGVGQYQHDVDQKLLKKKLDETVESCVNYVGVDLNTASKELLTHVSGLSDKIAENIINRRNEIGMFKNRKELLSVPKLGNKTYEQSAGFLRIRNGENPLDNTAVHPESYHIVEKIAKDINVGLKEITKAQDKLSAIDLKKYLSDKIGEHTLKDILSELEKPGRDPREEFKYAIFKEGITEISHLRQGMELEGIVTNITNFGCFVDVGVHQDGLVHISEMSDSFVKDPTKIIKVGQLVKVKVLDVNEKLKRIQLSMKSGKGNIVSKQKEQISFNLNDLKSKFK